MIPQDLYNKFLDNMVLACVDCCVVHDDKMLLVKRKSEPASGLWWFPGGRIIKGEPIKEASLRKVKEETGIDSEFVKILGVEETMFEKGPHGGDIHSINVVSILNAKNTEVILDNYSSEYQWVKGIYEYDHIHSYVSKFMELAGFQHKRKFGQITDPTDHVYL